MIILLVIVRLLIYASKRTLRHNWVSCLSQLSVMPLVMIEHLDQFNDSIPLLGLINPIPWFGLIRFILLSDLISPIILSECSSLHLPMEGGERFSQSYPIEYDWLGPELTLNTWGRYILILPIVLVTLIPDGPAMEVDSKPELVSYYISLAWSLL